MRLPRKPWLLLLAGLIVWTVAPAQALTLDPRPERTPVRLPDDLFAGQAETPGSLWVKIGVKKVKYSRVLETEALRFAQGSPHFAHAPGGPAASLALAPAAGAAELAFGRFNEVAVDALDANPDNPTILALTVRTPDGRTFASDPLECVERLGETYLDAAMDGVAVAKAEWTEKTPLYLIRRLLDLPFDDAWRTAEDGPSTFLQRRFDQDMLDLGAVDLILRRPAPVQVNLVAALDPHHPRQRTVLDWYGLAKRTFELPDGRTVLRVYVGRYLREHYPGLKSARLKEISLMFFRQGLPEVARDRLVERLVFTPSGLDPEILRRDGLPGRLPTRVREPFAGRKRVFVNIAPAAAALGQDGRATAELRLSAMAPNAPGGATLEGAALALVSPRQDTPAFLAAADELASSLGAAMDIDRADGGVSVTPLWSLPLPFAPGPGRAGRDTEAKPVWPAGLDGLFAADGGVRLYRVPGGLVVEGQGPRLTVPVDVAFSPQPDRSYFFRLDCGQAAGLAGVFLDVDGDGGPRTYALRPGAPTPLDGLPPRVTRAILRFAFTGRDFSLPLTRAMLAAVPRARPKEGLYSARLPWSLTTAARPVTEGMDGAALAFAPVTPLGRFSWFTAAYSLTGEAVRVAVAGGPAVVPQTRSGFLAALLPTGAPVSPLRLDLSPAQSAEAGRLELTDGTFTGQVSADWRELFTAPPLVALDRHVYRSSPVSEETAQRLHQADDWLNLGPAALPAGQAQARFFENPWLSVRTLCFETSQGLDLARFATPAKAGTAGSATLLRALAALAGLVVLLLAVRLARRAAWDRVLVSPARWLATPPADPAVRRRQALAWLGAALALILGGGLLGTVSGRILFGLAGAALVPVWRVLAVSARQRCARLVPALGSWVGADAGRSYFLGFALALVLAALLRTLNLARPSEFLAQAGLCLLAAGLFLEIAPAAGMSAQSRKDLLS